MHAQRVERDRPCDDQLVVAAVVGKRGRPKRPRRQKLGIGVGDPARRLVENLAINLGAERPQKLASRALHGCVVDAAEVGIGVGRLGHAGAEPR
jgi:hypothetical protein